MTVKFMSAYVTKSGDTLGKVVGAFRLSSRRALLEIAGNSGLDSFAGEEALPVGTRILIPPNAADLVRQRRYALNAIRPMLLAHFDEQALLAERLLRDDLFTRDSPGDWPVAAALAPLESALSKDRQRIATACGSLVEIGRAIAVTHVGTANDRSIEGSSVGELTGLYWLLTSQYIGVWTELWSAGFWQDKWQGRDAESRWRATRQTLNMVRSVVVQQADRRIRETLALERQLAAERELL